MVQELKIEAIQNNIRELHNKKVAKIVEKIFFGCQAVQYLKKNYKTLQEAIMR